MFTISTFAVGTHSIKADYSKSQIYVCGYSAWLPRICCTIPAFPFRAPHFIFLSKLVSDEAAKGNQAFEAFGMKFPAGQITLWGIVVLLGVQLYLLVYLKQLSGKLSPSDPGWDVPWIGMDQSLLGRIILFVTMVVLPCTAMIALGRYEISHLTHDYWASADQPCCLAVRVLQWDRSVSGEVLAIMFSIAISFALGTLSWRYQPRMVGNSAPSQLFE